MRTFVFIALIGVTVLFLASCFPNYHTYDAGIKRRAVIFDTDIGDDIDDTWALVALLNCDELDVKLITTSVGDTKLKAKMVAKILAAAGRTEIPIGVGVPTGKNVPPQSGWVEGFELSEYEGAIHDDGVGELIKTVMSSKEEVTIISVGPLVNIAAALKQEPGIAKRAEFIGMHGSVRKGYGGKDEIDAEYNVKAFASDAQKVFRADWGKTITPLDTCGIIALKNEKYQKVFKSNRPLAKELMEAYRQWFSKVEWLDKSKMDVSKTSTTLFDTVAVYLAVSQELVKMEELPLIVNDEGFTLIDEGGDKVKAAMEWKDLGAFEDWLVERLIR